MTNLWKDNITTTGNDIQQATNSRVGKEFSFSDKLGPLRYESNQKSLVILYLSKQISLMRQLELIDSEVKMLVKGEAGKEIY